MWLIRVFGGEPAFVVTCFQGSVDFGVLFLLGFECEGRLRCVEVFVVSTLVLTEVFLSFLDETELILDLS